jgi:hypothetical protein
MGEIPNLRLPTKDPSKKYLAGTPVIDPFRDLFLGVKFKAKGREGGRGGNATRNKVNSA